MLAVSAFNYEISRIIRSTLHDKIKRNDFEGLETWLAQHSAIYGSLIQQNDLFNVVAKDLKLTPQDSRVAKIQYLLSVYLPTGD